jgi:GGDEF domain-containing protein
VENKIRAVLGEEYSLGGVVHHSSASIGMKLFIGDECDPDQIIKEADAAMYEAKKTRSNVLKNQIFNMGQ